MKPQRLRMTILFEFDWEAGDVTQKDIDGLVQDFLVDPSAFLNIDDMPWDETLVVDVEDITEG